MGGGWSRGQASEEPVASHTPPSPYQTPYHECAIHNVVMISDGSTRSEGTAQGDSILPSRAVNHLGCLTGTGSCLSYTSPPP